MQKTLILMFLILLNHSVSAEPAQAITAKGLLKDCQSASDAPGSRAFCYGFVTAVYDGIQFYMRAQNLSERVKISPHFQICPAGPATPESLAEIVLDFAGKHEGVMALTAFSLTQMALVGAYPCREAPD